MYTVAQITLYIFGAVKVPECFLCTSNHVLLGISIGFFAANFAFVITTLAGRKIPATSLGLVFSLQYIISSVFIPVVRYISIKFDYRQTCWVIIGLFSLGIPFIIYGVIAIARLNPRLISKIPISIPEPHKVSVKVLRPEDDALIREDERSSATQNDQHNEDNM